MSIGASIGMNFINKGIDQFNYGVSQEYDRYAREKSREWQLMDYKGATTLKAGDIMRASKTYGIHPLALMGISGSPSSPISVGRSSAPSGGGSSIDFASRDTAELLREQTKQAKIETEYKQLELDLFKKGQNVSPPSTNGSAFSNSQGDTNADGLIDNVAPFNQQAMDTQGRTWQVPSQSLQEAVSDEAPWSTQVAYQWSILSDMGKAWLVKKFPNQAKNGTGELARFYDNWIKTRPKQDGFVFLWDDMYGWTRFKMGTVNPKALFVDDAGTYRSGRNTPRAKTQKSKFKRFPGWQGK